MTDWLCFAPPKWKRKLKLIHNDEDSALYRFNKTAWIGKKELKEMAEFFPIKEEDFSLEQHLFEFDEIEFRSDETWTLSRDSTFNLDGFL